MGYRTGDKVCVLSGMITANVKGVKLQAQKQWTVLARGTGSPFGREAMGMPT